MNFWKRVALLSVLLLSAVSALKAAEGVAAPAAPAAVQRVSILPLVNFGAMSNAYALGTWVNNISLASDGVTALNTANGKGGVGGDLALSLDDAVFLELLVITGPFNEVPSLKIQFEDNNGTTVAWYVSIAQIAPEQQVWLRVPIANMRVEKPGLDGAINLAKLVKWRVEGDNVTERPIHLKLLSLRARR